MGGQSEALEVRWMGRVPYREAWQIQHELVAARRAGDIGDQLLLLEHPAVLTLGRQSDASHIRAGSQDLRARGIEVIRVERGGEVTYHGPGQLVVYPIIRLADRPILLRPLVHALEQAMIDTAAGFGVAAGRREGFPGCWCDPSADADADPHPSPDDPASDAPRKLGALGLRIEGGVSYHGIALNVTTDLDDFAMIDPCGLPEVQVTSIAREARWPHSQSTPSTASVANAADRFAAAFAGRMAEAAAAAAQSGPTPAARVPVGAAG